MNARASCANIPLRPPTPAKREKEEEEGEGWVIKSLKWQKTKGVMEGEKKKSANKDVSPKEDWCPYNSDDHNMQSWCVPLLG